MVSRGEQLVPGGRNLDGKKIFQPYFICQSSKQTESDQMHTLNQVPLGVV